MHRRLLIELPDRLQNSLKFCIDRNPVPETTGVKLFHELDLGETIANTLSDLTVAVFEFPIDDAATSAVLRGEFIQAIEQAEVRYSTGNSSPVSNTKSSEKATDFDFVVCAFDEPDAALDMLRKFIQRLSDERVTQVRGALIAGIDVVAEDDSEGVMSRFAGSLERSQELARAAPPGTLLMNEAAFDILTDPEGVRLFNAVDALYAFSWQGPARTAKTTTPPADDSDGDSPEKPDPPTDGADGDSPGETDQPIDDSGGDSQGDTDQPADDRGGDSPEKPDPPTDGADGDSPGETDQPTDDSGAPGKKKRPAGRSGDDQPKVEIQA